MRAIVVRPAPGAARTLALLKERGIAAEAMPLFVTAPVDWAAPPARDFDAMLLTSANAVRHGGAGLATLASLPVVAVGPATAAVAAAAGLTVAITGEGDVAAVVARARLAGLTRLLHLAGRDRVAAGTAAVVVYASDPVGIAPGAAADFAGATVLLHSARAARRVAALVDRDGVDRSTIALGCFSDAVAQAAGAGWRSVAVAARPTDAALIEAAIDQHAARGDKTP